MSAKNCIFCKIANDKEFRTQAKIQVLYEDKDHLIFKDAQPESKFHYLAIPKTCIRNFLDSSIELTLDLLKIIKKLQHTYQFKNLKLITNSNKPYQEVFHYHWHILATQLPTIMK